MVSNQQVEILEISTCCVGNLKLVYTTTVHKRHETYGNKTLNVRMYGLIFLTETSLMFK